MVGAGGQAQAVVEVVRRRGDRIAAYCDPKPSPWLADADHLVDDDAAAALDLDGLVLGLGGVEPQALDRRLSLFRMYADRGWRSPPVVHDSAVISDTACLRQGAVVLAGAVVQPAAIVGEAAIVNTGAIVEHDCEVGAGSHLAPGAVVLGGARVGRGAMVGTGAVLLPGATVADGGLLATLEKVRA